MFGSDSRRLLVVCLLCLTLFGGLVPAQASADAGGDGPLPDTASTATGDGTSQSTILAGTGVLLVLVGTGVTAVARPVANFQEQMDAIGSTTDAADVEAARWKVRLYQVIGIGLILFGVFRIGLGVL